MSLYKDASLVMIPSAYKDGKLYSIRPTDGDGDFTFSRGSNLAATRVDVNGLIEKGRENLLLQSNTFSNASWVKSNASVTSGQSGYDGTSDAWLQQSTSTFCRLDQNITQTGVLTLSTYAKAGTSNFLLLEVTRSGGVFYAWFDLSSGVVGTTSAINANIESVGGGWYRCSLIGNQTLSGQARIRVADSNGSTTTTTSSNIYIQDAQLEQGLVATDYIETGATTAQAGILEDMPRLDYSGGASCPSLLLEPQRSNLAITSEYAGGSGWSIGSGYSVTHNAAISPEGVQNAFELTIPNVNGNIRAVISVSASTEYTFSFYAKRGTATELKYSVYDNTNSANIIASTSYYSQTSATEWKRIEVTFTTPAGCTNVGVYIDRDSQGDGTAFFYGIQLEEGSYPTSYIPTYGSSVTRSFDETSNLTYDDNFNSITAFVHITGDTLLRNSGDANIRIGHTTSNDGSIRFYRSTSSSDRKISVVARNLSGTNNISRQSTTEEVKLAIRYDSTSGDWELFENGVSVATATSNDYNEFDTFLISGKGGVAELHQLVVFPTALTDSECIALTTL